MFREIGGLGGYGDEVAMTRDSREILIGSEQGKSVLTACSRNEAIDGAGIDSLRATKGL